MIDRQQRQLLQNRQFQQQQFVFNKHVTFKSLSRVDIQAQTHMIEIEKISKNYYVENEYFFN